MDFPDLARLCKKRAIGLIKKNCIKSRRKLPGGVNVLESVGTVRDYICCVKIYLLWCYINAVPSDVVGAKSTLIRYLNEKSEIYRQKTLDQHRMALQMAYYKKLQFVKSKIETILGSRDYELIEVLTIIKKIEPKNAISILLCFYSGLRAHELVTIHKLNEGTPTKTREWSNKLFLAAEDYTIYLVKGKGGLCRQVAIPNFLVQELESYRLPEPQIVRDREIYYEVHYGIGFGQAISQCFTRASLKFLGWSKGLHGLRHSYTKNRINKLIGSGIGFDDAISIVSQELGHFRSEIIFLYLR